MSVLEIRDNTSTLPLSDIRNIYCVGRNYRLHAAELGNEVPSSPMLFTKPTHSIYEMRSSNLILPGSWGAVHYEAELVFAAGRSYEPGIRCDEIFDYFTIGLDLTFREVQDRLKTKGHPWLAAKGFRNSAPIGRWQRMVRAADVAQFDFGLRINQKEVQRGNMKDMVFDLQQLTDYTGEYYGLGAGDLLYTGTPAGVGSLKHNDEVEVWWNNQSLGDARVQIEN